QGQPYLGRAGRTGARTALRRGLRLVCCRSTRPGCEGGGVGGCGLTPHSHRGRCSYMKPGWRRRPDGRSTRPGCEWGRARGLWFDSAFAPRAVLLHKPEPAQGRGRYPPRVRRGRGRWLWFDSAFAPWAVLLHETGAGAGGRTVGAPAPGAKGAGSVVGVWLRFRTVGGAPTGNRAGAGVWMVGAPAPGAKGAGSVVGV